MPLTKYVIAEGGDLDYANDRHHSKGGVLCMYVSTQIHSMFIQDLNFFSNIEMKKQLESFDLGDIAKIQD